MPPSAPHVLRCLLGCLLGCLLAWALATPAAAEARPRALTTKLANGLTVIVIENHLVPLVAMEVVVRHGLVDEGARDSGTAHLLEHLLFRSNAALPTEAALAARRLELGLGILGSTEELAVRAGVTTPAAKIRDALVFVRDMVLAPRFDDAAIASERAIIVAEDEHRAGATDLRVEAIDRHLWWQHPEHKSNLGEGKILAQLGAEDLRRTHARSFVPGNAALIVVGDVDAAAVRAEAAAVFAGWVAAPAPARPRLPTHPALRGSAVVLESHPWPQVAGSLFFHGPSVLGPGDEATLARAVPLLEAAFKLGLVAPTGALGACAALDLDWLPSPNVGVMRVSFVAEPAAVDACLTAVLRDLPGALAGLTPTALATARGRVVGETLRAHESNEALVGALALAWAAADADTAIAATIDPGARLATVDPAAIARLGERYLRGRPFVLLVAVSDERRKAGLDQAHFEALVQRAGARPAPGGSAP